LSQPTALDATRRSHQLRNEKPLQLQGFESEADGTRTRNLRIDSRTSPTPPSRPESPLRGDFGEVCPPEEEARAAESAALDPWERWFQQCPGPMDTALIELARRLGRSSEEAGS